MNLILNINNIDEAKADTKSTRKMEFTFPGQDGEPVTVIYKSIKAGEMMSFITAKEDGGSFDARMVFQKKVVKIENLTVSDRNGRKKELKSAADVMSLKSFPELEGFIMAVFGRIIAESRLTEDEEKNSESATSASGRESSEEN